MLKSKEEQDGDAKVLGIKWNTSTDTISIYVGKLLSDIENFEELTKRVVCSFAARLFDSLGFMEPFTVRAKILMQELWTLKIGWDDPIPVPQNIACNKWIEEIKDVTEFKAPRRYADCNSDEIQQRELHVFCDSSEKAYGAVCYLRVVTRKIVFIQHVNAKSKVAPIKKQTMPRLEFLAALLACTVLNMLRSLSIVPFQKSYAGRIHKLYCFGLVGKDHQSRSLRGD